MYQTKILLDSISPAGHRLTTWELTYPRMVHAELMTHRLFSRNSASSRAIPINKMLERIENDPAMPVWWGRNQSGMQAEEELDEDEKIMARQWWLRSMRKAVKSAREGQAMGLHKQIVNRVTEPWMFITVILSATEFDNWWFLRDHKAAQPEIRWLARDMKQKYDRNRPKQIHNGGWHLPFIKWEDQEEALMLCEQQDTTENMLDGALEILKKVSVGRCARVSYLTHDGKRDLREDIKLHDKLIAGISMNEPGHWSPFEHVAQAMSDSERIGNFRGWRQYRKMFPQEHPW